MTGARRELVSLSLLCTSLIVLLASAALAGHFKKDRGDREDYDDEDRYLKIYSSDDDRNRHLHIFTEYIPRKDRHRYRSKNYKAMMTRGQRKHSKHRLQNIKSDDSYESERRNDHAEDDGGIAERMMFFGGERTSSSTKLKVSNLILKTCEGTEYDPIRIRDFQIIGPPIFPGDMKFGFDIESSANLASPIEGEVEAYKKVLGTFIKLPCINDMGSCTYEDVCKMSQYKKPCPSNFQKDNLPCTCPIPKGRYKTDLLELFVGLTDASNVPSWLTDGDYRGKITLRSGSKRLLCVQGTISVEKM